MTTHDELRAFNRSAATVDAVTELARKLTRRPSSGARRIPGRIPPSLVDAGEYLYSITCCSRELDIHAGLEAECQGCGARFFAPANEDGDALAIERARELAQKPFNANNPGAVFGRQAELVAHLEGLARRLERRLGL